MSQQPHDFFTQEHAERYDDRNNKLAPISNNLHFLISLILENLPSCARILSVGAGTGAEIISLAKVYSNWSFVAVEPSQSMLNVCRKRIEMAGFIERCEFVHGFAHELPTKQNFDAVLSVLVGHFVKLSERSKFYKNMADHLRSGGYLINAEISFDLDSDKFPQMLKSWESIQEMMGATPESLASLPKQLREVLTVLPPEKVEDLIHESGIDIPIQFFKAFMISGWYGTKK